MRRPPLLVAAPAPSPCPRPGAPRARPGLGTPPVVGNTSSGRRRRGRGRGGRARARPVGSHAFMRPSWSERPAPPSLLPGQAIFGLPRQSPRSSGSSCAISPDLDGRGAAGASPRPARRWRPGPGATGAGRSGRRRMPVGASANSTAVAWRLRTVRAHHTRIESRPRARVALSRLPLQIGVRPTQRPGGDARLAPAQFVEVDGGHAQACGELAGPGGLARAGDAEHRDASGVQEVGVGRARHPTETTGDVAWAERGSSSIGPRPAPADLRAEPRRPMVAP